MNNIDSHQKFLNYLSKCTSTNDRMKELVQRGEARHGVVLYSDHQTHGKGQHGKQWFDVPGKNLALSIFLKPKQWPVSEQYLLNKLVACAVQQSLEDFATLSIKWPNDIFYKDQKLAGVLIENSVQGKNIEHFIVGVGINVNGTQFPDFSPKPTSLKRITGEQKDVHALAEDIGANILNWFQIRSREEVETYYHRRLYDKGVYRAFSMEDGYQTASIKGVDRDGKLELLLSNGETRTFRHGEVKFIYG